MRKYAWAYRISMLTVEHSDGYHSQYTGFHDSTRLCLDDFTERALTQASAEYDILPGKFKIQFLIEEFLVC